MHPKVAIVIINWNGYEYTHSCLRSLQACNYDNFKIIVVDNGSEDDSGRKIKAEFTDIIYLQNEQNLGFSGGNNTAFEYLKPLDFDYVMLLNNDTIVTPDFLRHLVKSISKSEEIGAIQPKIMYNYSREIIWNAGGKYWPFLALMPTRGLGKRDVGQFDHPSYTSWISGCCLLLPMKILNEVGPLDEKFFAYYEDVDWSFKIKNLGYKLLYEPKAVIYHEAGASDKNWGKHNEGNISPFSRYLDVRNHLFIIRRYTRGLNLMGAYGYQFLKISAYIVYFLVRWRIQKLKSVLRGLRDGLTQ